MANYANYIKRTSADNKIMNENIDGFVPTHYEERIKPPLITFTLLLIGLALLGTGIALNLMPVDLGALTIVMMIIGGILVISCASYTIGRSRHINTEKDFDETRFYNWVLNNHGIVLSKDEVTQLFSYNFIVKDGVRYIMHYEIENGEIVGYLLFDKPANSFEFTSSLPVIPQPQQEEKVVEEEAYEEEIPELEAEEELIKEIESVSTDDLEKEAEAQEEVIVVEETVVVEEQQETPAEPEVKVETPTETIVEEKPQRKPRKPRVKKIDYSTLKLDELRKHAKEAGIKGYYKLKKEDLISSLQNK